MGACGISFTREGKLTKEQIEAEFRNQQYDDAAENGHRHGYSGDFQTVEKVVYQLDKVFENEDVAEEYCWDNAKKWMYVIAVYFKDGDGVSTLVGGKGAC